MALDRPTFRLFLKTRKGKIGMNKRGFIRIDVKYKNLILPNKLMRILSRSLNVQGEWVYGELYFFRSGYGGTCKGI